MSYEVRSLGETIFAWMRERGWSQRQLGLHAFVEENYVSKMRHGGVKRIGDDYVIKFADAFDIDPHILFARFSPKEVEIDEERNWRPIPRRWREGPRIAIPETTPIEHQTPVLIDPVLLNTRRGPKPVRTVKGRKPPQRSGDPIPRRSRRSGRKTTPSEMPPS